MLIKEISTLVKYQFPSFYREYGPSFIVFMQAYYEWLESEDQIIHQSRQLPETLDIDQTADQFLCHFKNKYMSSLPIELLGNQRLFQKHIFDLYRSKGSDDGLRLLFRLMFNEDVDKYVPSYDIFNLSDNDWNEPKYFEVSYSDYLGNFVNKVVTGAISGSTAVVEKYESKFIDDKPVYLLFVSNISGNFILKENLLYETLDPENAPSILGSPTSLTVKASFSGLSVGDILVDTNEDVEVPLKAIVASTYIGSGIILFGIEDGGSHYSVDANVTVSTGANTSGSGADFYVSGITDTYEYGYSTILISDIGTVMLNANTWAPGSNVALTANIELAFPASYKTVGTISELTTLSIGSGYDANVSVSVVDELTSAEGIITSNGSIGGTNAVLSGTAIFGSNITDEIKVFDSGYGYNDANTLITFNNGNSIVTAYTTTAAIGTSEGFFQNNKSFVSSDKYLFDGHYYQDFSYVVKAERSLETYVDVLKKVFHPAGNRVYGSPTFTDQPETRFEEISSIATQTAL